MSLPALTIPPLNPADSPFLNQPRDDVYGAYDNTFMHDNNGPKQNTQQPIVTGTSVVAIKFKDGVVIAADNLGPYPLLYDSLSQLGNSISNPHL